MTAPLAPARAQQHLVRETFVEKRNYEQLKWNSTYPQYYNHNRKEETSQYLSNKINKRATNWKFYKYQNNEIAHIRSLRGHTVSDCGDSIITIGDRKKKPIIDIYKLNKQMNKIEKVTAANRSPRYRFHHSAEFIPSLNQILFFGGFDSSCNYNDARLFSLNNNVWSDLVYDANIDYRAFHSSATQLITTINKYGKVVHKWQCYIFGGQYCAGGPYQYHNDMFRFTFVDTHYDMFRFENDEDDDKNEEDNETLGYFQCDEIQYNGNNFPIARSQNHSFIKDNTLYIYGGSYATSTLNDLWSLDLNTMIWTEIEYRGILKAPSIKSLTPRNYRVVSFRKACYFDEKLNQLIVFHFGKLSDVQRKFIKCEDSLSEYEQRMIENKNVDTEKDKKGLKKGVIGLLRGGCTVFVFDLKESKWLIKRSRNITQKEKAKVPTNDIGTTRIVRVGECIVFIGGGTKQSAINYMKHMYLLKIPNNRVICTMSWSRERLIWIAHYKTNDEEDEENVSVFTKCAKDVIQLIISFLNPR